VLTASIDVAALASVLRLLQMNAAGAAETARAAGVDPGVTQWAVAAAAAAAGLSTLAAGYAVAVVGSAAVGALAEKPELLGRVLILVGLAEGIAIYGLIVAVLILNRAG
jgi:V/A-type H+-transporting ATPase subunit K